MIVPFEESNDTKLPSIVKHKKHSKKKVLSYYEQVEEEKLKYRNCRVPRRVPTPRPPTPPEIEEEIVVKKPKGKVKEYEVSLSEAAERSIKALCLTNKQVRKLKRKFNSLGANGEVTKASFWAELEIKPSAFTDKLFEMVDSDNSGVMDFSEFISILITYCIFDQDDILRFAFSCFDKDGSGQIDSEEVKTLVEMINSQDPKFKGSIDAAEAKISADEDGMISFPEFKELNRSFPLLLQPAFELQAHMHEHTLGDRDWVKVMENMAHSQLEHDLKEKQFGMPVKKKQWRKATGGFGLSRKFPNIDIAYINLMRPSKIANMPPSLDEIDDIEDIEGDDLSVVEEGSAVAGPTGGSLAKRMSVAAKALENKRKSQAKTLISQSGPQAAFEKEQSMRRAKEKHEALLKEETRKAKASGGFFNSLNHKSKFSAKEKKKKQQERKEDLLAIEGKLPPSEPPPFHLEF